LIGGSRFIVMPYLDYAHSSILISCARHGGAVIVSDIDLFRDFLPDYDLTCSPGDVDSLVRVLDASLCLQEADVNEKRRLLLSRVEQFDKELEASLAVVYADFREALGD